jgi:hypothetical protein
VAPAGLNVLIVLIAIGLAVAVGVVLAVFDIRSSAHTPARPVVPPSAEVVEAERRAA